MDLNLFQTAIGVLGENPDLAAVTEPERLVADIPEGHDRRPFASPVCDFVVKLPGSRFRLECGGGRVP